MPTRTLNATPPVIDKFLEKFCLCAPSIRVACAFPKTDMRLVSGWVCLTILDNAANSAFPNNWFESNMVSISVRNPLNCSSTSRLSVSPSISRGNLPSVTRLMRLIAMSALRRTRLAWGISASCCSASVRPRLANSDSACRNVQAILSLLSVDKNRSSRCRLTPKNTSRPIKAAMVIGMIRRIGSIRGIDLLSSRTE